MIVKFAKWGNSIGVRIPAAFAEEVGAIENGTAELSIEGRKLVLTPVEEIPTFDLDELVAKITDANRHEEISTGHAVGAEFG
ncbi:MAG TPA: AbrB/MazE/SpoVT family DNA-binding domain-containing protein [Stellaceae bacterium]|nr:AbrB/MazE/SpoVT family DNA-binding domain-containing protein [Stellaceae bacterium]